MNNLYTFSLKDSHAIRLLKNGKKKRKKLFIHMCKKYCSLSFYVWYNANIPR